MSKERSSVSAAGRPHRPAHRVQAADGLRARRRGGRDRRPAPGSRVHEPVPRRQLGRPAGQLRQRRALPVRAQLVRHLLLGRHRGEPGRRPARTRSPAPTRSGCRSTSRPSPTYWGTYTGAIDTALTKGNVILAYWAYSGGKPAEHDGVQPDVGHRRRASTAATRTPTSRSSTSRTATAPPTWTTSTTPG